eukprot:2658519-Alexandrium_andersonii.AAC.1
MRRSSVGGMKTTRSLCALAHPHRSAHRRRRPSGRQGRCVCACTACCTCHGCTRPPHAFVFTLSALAAAAGAGLRPAG